MSVRGLLAQILTVVGVLTQKPAHERRPEEHGRLRHGLLECTGCRFHHCRRARKAEDTYLLSDGLWLTEEAVDRNASAA